MGQQPNIELDAADAPRRQAVPGSARSWRPQRPGELNDPRLLPQGGPFGIVGPDAGYALKLVALEELELLPGESRHDAEVAVAALATARAARIGRAPVAGDVAAAVRILKYDAHSSADRRRVKWVGNVSHDAAKLRGLVADVPPEVLAMSLADLDAALESHDWAMRS